MNLYIILLMLVAYSIGHALLNWQHGDVGEVLATLGGIASFVLIFERLYDWYIARQQRKRTPFDWSPETKALMAESAKSTKRLQEMVEALKRAKAERENQ